MSNLSYLVRKRHGSRSVRLTVLHVTEAPLGGVASYMQEMLPVQAASAWVSEVHALIPNVNRPTLDTLASQKLKVHSYSQTRNSPIGLARLAVATTRLMFRVKPDILHVHATVAGLIARLCAQFMVPRPKIVYCPHGWLFNQKGIARSLRPLIRTVEKLLGAMSDLIVCVSEHEQRCAVSVGLPIQRCVLVRSGISDVSTSDRVSGRSFSRGDRIRVLYVGRFDVDKGFDTYLEAMRRVGDHADGYAVGAYLTDRQEMPLIPKNVSIQGWCDRAELRTLYEGSDVLVMPSRAEAFGLVALEAMRSGLPVFCSRTGGLTELVLDGATGRHFNVDDVDELVDLLRRTSRATLQRYGKEGRKRFLRHFTADMMNQTMLEQYCKLTPHTAAPSSSTPVTSAALEAM